MGETDVFGMFYNAINFLGNLILHLIYSYTEYNNNKIYSGNIYNFLQEILSILFM